MNDAMRIRELEDALRAAVEHMRKLPINSITARVVRESVATLEGSEPTFYTTSRHTPAGTMVLGAVMSKNGLTIRTGDPVGGLTQRHKDLVFDKLLQGYTLPLPSRVRPEDYSFPELARIMAGGVA